MKNEYIIIDNINQWLGTYTSKKEALKKLSFFKKLSLADKPFESFEEIGDILYLYEAKEINRVKCY